MSRWTQKEEDALWDACLLHGDSDWEYLRQILNSSRSASALHQHYNLLIPKRLDAQYEQAAVADSDSWPWSRKRNLMRLAAVSEKCWKSVRWPWVLQQMKQGDEGFECTADGLKGVWEMLDLLGWIAEWDAEGKCVVTDFTGREDSVAPVDKGKEKEKEKKDATPPADSLKRPASVFGYERDDAGDDFLRLEAARRGKKRASLNPPERNGSRSPSPLPNPNTVFAPRSQSGSQPGSRGEASSSSSRPIASTSANPSTSLETPSAKPSGSSPTTSADSGSKTDPGPSSFGNALKRLEHGSFERGELLAFAQRQREHIESGTEEMRSATAMFAQLEAEKDAAKAKSQDGGPGSSTSSTSSSIPSGAVATSAGLNPSTTSSTAQTANPSFDSTLRTMASDSGLSAAQLSSLAEDHVKAIETGTVDRQAATTAILAAHAKKDAADAAAAAVGKDKGKEKEKEQPRVAKRGLDGELLIPFGRPVRPSMKRSAVPRSFGDGFNDVPVASSSTDLNTKATSDKKGKKDAEREAKRARTGSSPKKQQGGAVVTVGWETVPRREVAGKRWALSMARGCPADGEGPLARRRSSGGAGTFALPCQPQKPVAERPRLARKSPPKVVKPRADSALKPKNTTTATPDPSAQQGKQKAPVPPPPQQATSAQQPPRKSPFKPFAQQAGASVAASSSTAGNPPAFAPHPPPRAPYGLPSSQPPPFGYPPHSGPYQYPGWQPYLHPAFPHPHPQPHPFSHPQGGPPPAAYPPPSALAPPHPPPLVAPPRPIMVTTSVQTSTSQPPPPTASSTSTASSASTASLSLRRQRLEMQRQVLQDAMDQAEKQRESFREALGVVKELMKEVEGQ